jgi:hypothetical protein
MMDKLVFATAEKYHKKTGNSVGEHQNTQWLLQSGTNDSNDLKFISVWII